MIHRKRLIIPVALGLMLLLVPALYGQTDTKQGSAPASTGVFVAGDYWDGITPDNLTPYTDNRWWRETGADALNNHTFIHMGNQNRLWNVPTTMWPGGWNYGQYWSHNMRIAEYNPDATFYPSSPHNSTNKANYAFGTYGTKIPGAGDPARDYVRLTKWVDPNTRTQVIYEAGFPTTLGVDIKIVARQFTVNWANMNDFIIMEFTLTNTGIVDLDKNGTPDRTNNKINALCLGWNGTPMVSYYLTNTGGRGNDFNVGRNTGYVGDNDPTGAPWDMVVSFPGVDPTRIDPATRGVLPGKLYNLGVNGAQALKSYTDVWTFNSFLAVKKGSGNPANADKTTLYGTHPIGTGAQRGWYHSVMQGNGIGGFGGDAPPTSSTPEGLHKIFMGAWYKSGGKENNAAQQDFNPNPNFFASGTTGNPTTFVPKASGATRPNGDKKLYSEEVGVAAFSQGPWENGKADGSTNYPTGFGTWTKGFVFEHTFGGDIMNAVGPFSLDVGESITIVWVEGGGYRLEGVQRSLLAARYAYENAWGAAPGGYIESKLPTPPPAPDMTVTPTQGRMDVRWDARAEADPQFAGYKIWRAQGTPKLKLIDGGMRGMDRYQEQMTLGTTEASLLKPINPKFDAVSEVQTLVSPDSWGPYSLVTVIPKAQLAQYTNASGSYKYLYQDKEAILGFTYWYYVAAYKEGSYTGPAGATTTRLESHKININGKSGLWYSTYPFASSPVNAFLPTDAAGQRALGMGSVTTLEVPTAGDIASGKLKIFVKPNPYKRTALFDIGLEHKVAFNNIPNNSKITILDVAGQIIFQQTITNPSSGTFFWDLFSKDGMEVANGLYIYIVEYPGGMEKNYLAIMR